MSFSQQPLRQGDVLAKKYEVDASLGSGPQGATWLARSLSSPKKFAIKQLVGPAAPDAAAAAVIQRVNSVSSEALVRIADTGEHLGSRWVAYEHVEGDPLRRLMDEYAGQRKAFTLQEACQIVVKVLEAAEAAHAAGLVHRHLRPTNVIIQSRSVGPGQGKVVRTVRVLGLGFSELVSPAILQEAQLERGFGSYLAPELASPSSGGTPQSDVYSAGVIFYELLCGQTPMGTYLSPTQIRDDLPKHVDDIVDLALAANAEDRYPTARDMINDIQRSFQDEDKPAAGISKKTLAGVIGGTLVLVAVAAAVLLAADPDAGARRKDEQLRAEVIKENPLPSAEEIKQKLAGREDMVYIPAGTFIRGRMNAEDGRTANAKEPLAERAKMGAFYIDRFEWENQKGGNPVVGVSQAAAAELCASKGKRLCSADEWERACKGPANTLYAYGDTFDAAKCGPDVAVDADRDQRSDWTSGAQEGCASGWGVFDLSGGPREWTSTAARARPASSRNNDTLQGRSNQTFALVKGGKTGEPVKGSRCAFGEERSPALVDRTLSFRCCLDEGAPAPTAGAAPAAAPADGAPAPDAPK